MHLEVRWFESMGDTVELAVFGGPTFFNLQQDLVTTIGYDHVYPYAEASFASASTAPASASAVGFNAGIDIGFFLSEVVGLGAIIHSGGTVARRREHGAGRCRRVPRRRRTAAQVLG